MNESGVRRGRRSTWYFLLLVLVNLMWAFQYTGARIATRKLGPFTVTLLPMAMAALLLGILLFSRRVFLVPQCILIFFSSQCV